MAGGSERRWVSDQAGVSKKDDTTSWETVLDTGNTKLLAGYQYQTYVAEGGTAKSSESVQNVSVTLPYQAKAPCLTVIAYYLQDGTYTYADFDCSVNLEEYPYRDKSVLYIGDSITYGTPYTGQNTGNGYSFPAKVSQVTGVRFYNAGIPGASLAVSKSKSGNFIDAELIPLSEGKTPTSRTWYVMAENTSKLTDFDVVVVEGGANDYSCNVPIGTTESTEEDTFYGAWNTIFATLIQASRERVAAGKAPMKIIVMDLFYSAKDNDQVTVPNSRANRKNNLNLTYTDYQNAVNNIVAKYQGMQDIQLYHFKTQSYQLVTPENCAYTTVDNLHLTTQTAAKLGERFASFLEEALKT